MDYCSSCRRHLNGALVCPGCGAYAPDIDPSAAPGARLGQNASQAGNVWDDPSVWEEADAGTREIHLAHTGSAAGPAKTPAADTPDGSGTADTDATATGGFTAPPQGRAARRRQMARWKKNQRRAVVATAFALVGGGLTVAGMNGNATDSKQSATAPGDTAMGGTGGQAPTYTEPTSSRRDTPRSSPTPATTPASHREQPRAARTTPTDTRTDSGSTPRALPKTTQQPRTTDPDAAGSAAGGAGDSPSTVTERTTPPTADDGHDTQQSADTAPPPPAASPTPAETPPSSGNSDPKELCLVVVCLG
ncbi:SCO2400 family protein [Streptomyces djakartensis]|uniref:Zinc ribbon domain-containing protein n=1 Tax=Streptomyces djakartensis TaxID=68193 RepID=A0ABQ2ZA89_9ACTN|nr:hypothetical protein [Streptomyces djakartensis]GGY06883.1 hypothetical protein GCM10010384_08990 [Streptomyces djakartensis]